MSLKRNVREKYTVIGSWEPDPEDLWDYAMNVEDMYDILRHINTRQDAQRAAEVFIERYNQDMGQFEARQYKGTPDEVSDYIWENRDDV